MKSDERRLLCFMNENAAHPTSLCNVSYLPTGGHTHLLTARVSVSTQSFNPGPEHLKQKHMLIV